MKTYEQLAIETAKLLEEKRKAYGGAFENCSEFLEILYPDNISIDQYPNMLVLIRIFDKMMRIANQKDAFGEDPYQDIVGYGLLAMRKVDRIVIRGSKEKVNENKTKSSSPIPTPKPTGDKCINISPTLSGLEGTPCPCCSGARPDGTLHTESECDAEFARTEGP